MEINNRFLFYATKYILINNTIKNQLNQNKNTINYILFLIFLNTKFRYILPKIL